MASVRTYPLATKDMLQRRRAAMMNAANAQREIWDARTPFWGPSGPLLVCLHKNRKYSNNACFTLICVFVCLFDCLFVCLLACLFSCLFVCLCVSLFVCLLVCLPACCCFVCLLACFVCLFDCLIDFLFACLLACFFCLFVCLLACLFVCLCVCVFACLSHFLLVSSHPLRREARLVIRVPVGRVDLPRKEIKL